MKFDKAFFIKQEFSVADLERFRGSALHDLELADSGKHPEVTISFYLYGVG